MADKKITDLTLRDNVSDEVNFPVDDGIQSYRVTAAQVKDFILPDEGVTRAKIIEAQRIPVGAIFPFAGGTIPAGYLICEGAAVNRTTYADLFAVIGITHGQGDGSTTFNLPDFRGRFLRGRANGSANDPDRASRTAMATGGATGDNVGSVQAGATSASGLSTNTTGSTHTHVFRADSNSTSTAPATTSGGGTIVTGNASPGQLGRRSALDAFTFTVNDAVESGLSTHTHGIAGSSETRPINAYENFIIKF